MKEIILRGKDIDKKCIVDDEDFERLNKYKWYLGTSGYVVRVVYLGGGVKDKIQKQVYIHRIILNCPIGKFTDHINHNKLDNRKSNLRICSLTENNFNKKTQSNNKSGYKGVYWDKFRNKWVAQFHLNRKHYYIGRFDDKIEAAKAYNNAIIKIAGEFARLNEL